MSIELQNMQKRKSEGAQVKAPTLVSAARYSSKMNLSIHGCKRNEATKELLQKMASSLQIFGSESSRRLIRVRSLQSKRLHRTCGHFVRAQREYEKYREEHIKFLYSISTRTLHRGQEEMLEKIEAELRRFQQLLQSGAFYTKTQGDNEEWNQAFDVEDDEEPWLILPWR